ncbi:MAG: RNA 2',3'-cyclic phosphodiesterase [Nitrospinota bacterium]
MNEETVNEEPEGGRKTKRCFVAVPAPPEICERATEIQDVLRKSSGLQRIRWLNPDGLHITVKFLGDVPAEDIPYIAEQLAIVASGCWPSVLPFDRLGVFPNPKRARVLWWGSNPKDVPAEVRALHFHVQEALHLLGFEKEERPFQPHITLGRMKENPNPVALAEAMKRPASLTETRFPVRGIELMESRLRPQGAVYETLAVLPIEEDEKAGPAREN